MGSASSLDTRRQVGTPGSRTIAMENLGILAELHDEQVRDVPLPPTASTLGSWELAEGPACDPLGELGERTWPRRPSCPQQRDALDRSLGLRTVVRPRVDSRSPMIGLAGWMDHHEPRRTTGLQPG